MTATTVVLADVRTNDPALPRAEAVLVGGERVLAVGSREEMLALAPRSEVADHRDLVLTPGLTDAHVHLVGYGFSLGNVDLTGTRSVGEVRARLAERTASVPPGTWVQGSGFSLSELGLSGYPTAEDLDEVSPHHPVLLYSRDMHLGWANSLALRLAGVSETTPDPEGGRIVRPLGTLLEYAKALVADVIPTSTAQELVEAARRGAEDLRARGFVGVHSMGYEGASALRAVLELDARGELPLRVWACVDHDRLEIVRGMGLYGGIGGRVVVGGVKYFAD